MSGWITLYTQVVHICTPGLVTMYTLCLAELQFKHLCQDGLQCTHYVRKAYIVHSHTRNPSHVPLVALRWRKGFIVCSMAVCIAALPLVFILSRLIKNKSFCNFVVDADTAVSTIFHPLFYLIKVSQRENRSGMGV